MNASMAASSIRLLAGLGWVPWSVLTQLFIGHEQVVAVLQQGFNVTWCNGTVLASSQQHVGMVVREVTFAWLDSLRFA
jgi:hypothetical protein